MKRQARRIGPRKCAGWMISVASAAAAAALAVGPMQPNARAADVYWKQPAGGSWTGPNWVTSAPSNPPAEGDRAAFNLPETYNVNLNVSPTVAAVQVHGSNVTFTNTSVGSTFTNTGTLRVTAGSFTLNSPTPVSWTNGGVVTFNANAFVGKGNDLSAPSLEVGSGGLGNPVVTFTGAGTTLNLSGGIGVGNGGLGTLNLSTFSTTTAAGAIDIATSGTVGSGVLIVQNGATLSSQGIRLGTDTSTTLGRTAGIHVGGVTSTLTNTGAVTVGGGAIGSGSISVTSSGAFTTGGGNVTVSKAGLIDVQSGSFNADADVTIDGGEMTVALFGTFNLGAGRAMTVKNNAYASISGGYPLPASSTLTVTGTGTTFIQDTLGSVNVSGGSVFNIGAGTSVSTLSEYIGHDSNGSATQTGGTHTIAPSAANGSAQLVVGTGAGVTGSYDLSGGTLTVTNNFVSTVAVVVGWNGTGNFVQTNSVHTINGSHGSLIIGHGATGVGTYAMTNATLGCDRLDIGLESGAQGALTVNAGSVASALDGAIRLGVSAGATGTATTTAGGVLSGKSIYVGGSATDAGGAGVLNISGGNVSTAGETRVWNTPGSAINLLAGSFSTGSLDTSGNPARFNWTGGDLHISAAKVFHISATGPIGATVNLAPNKSLSVAKRLNIAAGASVALVGGGNLSAGSLSGAGALSSDANSMFIGSDQTSTTFTGTITGNGSFVKVGAGTLTVASTRIAKLTIQQGSIAVIPTGGLPAVTSTVSELTIADGGKLDLADNKLIVRETSLGTATGGTYDGAQGQVQRAYGGGTWNGPDGITTSMTAATNDGLTTVAVATAEQVGIGTFGGIPVSGSDVLFMYTYAGDTNFDGRISGDDYGTIDFAMLVGNADGYFNGDFNYDGVVNGDDYGVIDFTIIAQGTPFPASGTSEGLSRVTAVPEPSACGFAASTAAAAALLRRRRRGTRTGADS